MAVASRYGRPRHHRKVSPWLVVADAGGLTLAWSLSFGLLWLMQGPVWRQGIVDWWAVLGDERLVVLNILLMVALAALGVRGHYSRRRPFSEEVLDITRVFFVIAVLDAAFAYFAKWQFSRIWFITAWLLTLVFVPLARSAVKVILIRAHRWQGTTAILGIGQNAVEAANALNSESLMGFEIVAFLAPAGENRSIGTLVVEGTQIPVLPLGDDPDATLDKLGSPHIIVALEAESLLLYQPLLQKLSARYGELRIIPPLKGLPLYGMQMTHFLRRGVLMLTVRNNLARSGMRFVKRVFDFAAATVLVVFLAPLMAFFSWRIRQTGGRAIFGHLRVGQYGKPFMCLKFSTMVPNANEVLEQLLASDPQARAEWGRDFKLKQDPRITPIGAFLRETSLDELPQLWNVLKGEMSLVGPRPIIEEELERYGNQVGYYLEAPPGMTGLWQVSGRSDKGYDDRVALDCWYARNWSLWHDLVILIKTVRVVLARKGAY